MLLFIYTHINSFRICGRVCLESRAFAKPLRRTFFIYYLTYRIQYLTQIKAKRNTYNRASLVHTPPKKNALIQRMETFLIGAKVI